MFIPFIKSGLEYETGVFEPDADIPHPVINFANSHTNTPRYVIIEDVTGTLPPASSLICWAISVFEGGVSYSSSAQIYGRVQYEYRNNSNAATASGYNLTTLTGTTTAALSYWVDNTMFSPYMGSTTRFFRAGRTYNWFAVW